MSALGVDVIHVCRAAFAEAWPRFDQYSIFVAVLMICDTLDLAAPSIAPSF